MQDKELYEELLGIQAPWRVSRVELDARAERVDIWVEHGEGEAWNCSECGEALAIYDHSEELSWRHLDTCQCQTHLHARIPRVQCPRLGCYSSEFPGRSRSHGSPCGLNVWRLTCSGSAT